MAKLKRINIRISEYKKTKLKRKMKEKGFKKWTDWLMSLMEQS